uniref:uncharacterized protein LOC120344290 n=1 Tax=Styela clava TaxID=7725 RepID=UPI0019396FEC|nr:uncharacterized protein LOC120344290 [Styela clava]
MTILKNHIRSKHLKVRKDVDKIMQNLMALSLDGMERGIVVFTKYDFEKHDLDIDDIKDLVISVPTPDKNIVCDQNLLEEDYSFFFVHQTIQELLAACEMANLNLLQYKELIDKQIHTSKYGVVRQMLCGLLFNKSTAKMSFLKNHYRDDYIIETKQEYLLDSLRKDLNGGNIPPMRMLNILICLCECGADERIVQLAKTNIKKIYLSGIPLTTSDLHALGSVTYHCDRLSIMALDNCQLNTYDLKVLSDELGDSDVEITVFDVCFNRSLLKNSMYYLHKICIRGQGLNYWQCGFRQSDILDFDEKTAKNAALDVHDVTVQGATEKQQIKTMLQDQKILDFSDYNTQHHFPTLEELIIEANTKDSVNVSLTEYERNSVLTNLCQLLNQCIKIGEFKISECELTENQLEQIMQAIPEQEIQMVNVFLTPDIQPNGWKIIGEITKTFKAKTLAVTSCSLTKEKLAELKLSLGQWTIDRFDLSRNSNMDVSCLNQVGEIIRNCATNDLVMGYCNLTSNQMSSLKASLHGENGPAKLHRIDISGNDNLGVDGFKALGQISDMCETKELDVSECDPSPQEIRSFKDAVNTEKLTKLNVSRNRNMGEWGLYYIGELVGKCKLKTLFVRQCELEEKTLAKFAEGMKKAKIDLLSFGLYFMKPRITTQAEIDILLNLLPNVNKELTLDAWSFGSRKKEYEKLLQDELDKLEFIEPGVKIVFERGQERYVQQRKPSA